MTNSQLGPKASFLTAVRDPLLLAPWELAAIVDTSTTRLAGAARPQSRSESMRWVVLRPLASWEPSACAACAAVVAT